MIMIRKPKIRNPKHWKTKNSIDDVKKFELIRNNSLNSKSGFISDKTLELQIQQVKKIHEEFPLVRFYGFHKSAKEFAEKHYGCMWDYSRCTRLPDGYYFDYPEEPDDPDLPWFPSIFIIEIENYSRVDIDRVHDYLWWWYFFDGAEYTALHIMEFNRYGEFQRDLIKESSDDRDSVEILKNPRQKIKSKQDRPDNSIIRTYEQLENI